MAETPKDESSFDQFAVNYDAALEQGLAVSGESKEYFARGRIQFLAQRLTELNFGTPTVLDFGCGTGSAIPFFFSVLHAGSVVGVDVSEKSLEIARQQHKGRPARFLTMNSYRPNGDVSLAFCNGVFHHIPPPDRPGAIRFVFRSLIPGGYFALWENNPWNPGARLVMKRIPFDRDALMLSSRETQRLLRAEGFEIVRTDFLFIFPRALGWLRSLEEPLSPLPLGAQYQVLARRPA